VIAIFPSCHLLGMMSRKGEYGLGEASCGQVHLRGELISLRPAMRRQWRTKHGRGRRHAFLWRHIVLGVEK